MTKVILAAAALLSAAGVAGAQAKARAAKELAEVLIAKYGAKAGQSVPRLAARIEGVAAKHGAAGLVAVERGGPAAYSLIEAAGADGARAVRVLATHGEAGAVRVLSRPRAMRQFLRFGEDAAAALVRHPGVAEPLIERGGAQAVKALGSVVPRNGRRLAMLVEGELAGSAARHPEVLSVVAKHGDRAAEFIWNNKGTLAGGAALAAFLANPEPFLDGTRRLAEAAGDAVIKPVAGGVVTALAYALAAVVAVVALIAVVVYKHGPPGADAVKAAASLFKK